MALPSAGKYVLTLSLIFTLVLGLTLEAFAHTPYDEVEWVRTQLPMEMNNRVVWMGCGDWNGYYYNDGHIELCKENLDQGVGVARFIYLHELGHAYTFGHDTVFSRWGGNYEDAADEFAALFSIVQGRDEDVLATAMVYDAWGKTHRQRAGDAHSPMEVRATRLRSMVYGYRNPQSTFGEDWRSVLSFWHSEMVRNGLN